VFVTEAEPTFRMRQLPMLGLLRVDKTEIRFVYQRGRLQCLTRLLVREPRRRSVRNSS
jgi:hypothetical protein